MEIWKDIIGYEGIYQVSNLGRIKRLKIVVWTTKHSGYYKVLPEIIMKSLSYKEGKYQRINLYKNGKLNVCPIHKLVLCAFDRFPISGEVGMHKDNNGNNNNILNLKWGTQKENVEQCHREGRNADVRGIKNPRTTCTEEEILKIKQLYRDNPNVVKVSKLSNKSYHFIYDIITNRKWASLTL